MKVRISRDLVLIVLAIFQIGLLEAQEEKRKVIDEAKSEFDQRRGPDFKYKALLGDREPALDYRK